MVTDLGAHHLADPLQQRADLLPVRCGVEEGELVGASGGEAMLGPVLFHAAGTVIARSASTRRRSRGGI